MGVAALLAELEAISRCRSDRVLRLRGALPAEIGAGWEPFELLIFRGFSSSVSHPTAFDPDQPALAESAQITAAELLQGPLNPAQETLLAGPVAVEAFREPGAWL
ncbi:hypothetical protein [Vulcanococcus sp.]|jgi:hypothetical protein|uniref:DUF7734 family protein n=1 Tax=Vulcanococcus sp. TaxID=2856995 RepID=UPI0037DA053A